jgi:hypothetical protein
MGPWGDDDIANSGDDQGRDLEGGGLTPPVELWFRHFPPGTFETGFRV